jgi:hypothetical protein
MGNSSHRAATQAFYDNVLMLSSDEESNSETDLLMAAAGMVNKHFLMPPRIGGSSKSGRATSIVIEKLGMCAYTMISMCCSALRYFLGLPNALHLRYPIRSMVTLMIMVII